jgi:NAD-dependent dihydropyrimidine dehydrogenase PreA subunit
LQIIDGKARLVSDLFCDGLGACVGYCPRGAITIEEREAEKYDEKKVMANIVKQGENVIGAHLKHLKEHAEKEYFKQAMDFLNYSSKGKSQLKQWPIQIMLVPSSAPYFKDADLLIAADCVAFTYADFQQDLLKGKVLLVGCPKLDNFEVYQEKIARILKDNNIKSITYAHMEVPCCFGLVDVIKQAISESNKATLFYEVVISIKGERLG